MNALLLILHWIPIGIPPSTECNSAMYIQYHQDICFFETIKHIWFYGCAGVSDPRVNLKNACKIKKKSLSFWWRNMKLIWQILHAIQSNVCVRMYQQKQMSCTFVSYLVDSVYHCMSLQIYESVHHLNMFSVTKASNVNHVFITLYVSALFTTANQTWHTHSGKIDTDTTWQNHISLKTQINQECILLTHDAFMWLHVTICV